MTACLQPTMDGSMLTEKINDLANKAINNGYSFIVLTSNSFEEIDKFRHKYQTPYDFYQSDERELKTIIRSNPGLVLMKNGIVLGKWHYRNIPSYEVIFEKYMNL